MVTSGGAVTTLAGSGVKGYAEGIGAAAQFSNPNNVAVFGTSTLYVCDHAGQRIRSVATATGTTSLVTGNGTKGFHDGPVAFATIASPRGITVDASGVIFFGCQSNYAIRKISGGTVLTIAGWGVAGDLDGVGVSAGIGKARDLSLDDNGFLWMADSELPGSIRMMDTSTGLMTTMITDVRNTYGVAVNAASTRLYVAVSYNVTAYGVHPTVTASPLAPVMPPLSWVAGTGAPGDVDGDVSVAQFNKVFFLAVDPATDDVVAPDFNTHKVYRLAQNGTKRWFSGTGVQATVDGAAAVAQFNNPTSVCVDASGATYIGQYGDDIIRSLTPAGAASTLAGSVAGYAEGTGASALFTYPAGLATHGTTLYVCDHGNNRVRSVDTSTGISALVAGNGTKGFTDGPFATVSAPRGVVVAAAGVVFFSCQNNFAIRKISGGSVTTIAGTGQEGDGADDVGVSALLGKPRQIAMDGRGFLWIADQSYGRVRMLDTATGLVTTMLSGFLNLYGIAVNARGTQLYVADNDATRANVSAYFMPTQTHTPSISGSKTSTVPLPTPAPTTTAAPPTSTASAATTVAAATTAVATTAAATTAAATTTAAPNTTSAPTAAATAAVTTASPGAASGNSNSLGSGSGSGAAGGAGSGDCQVAGMACYLFGLLIAACVAIVVVTGIVVATRLLRKPAAADKLEHVPTDDGLEGAAVVIDLTDGEAAAQAADDEDEDW
jgi:sugar lactone lactonase YvrE